MDTMDLYDSFDLYTSGDKYLVQPRSEAAAAQPFLVLDRITNEIRSSRTNESVPLQAERTTIYGVVGVIRLVAGPYLIIIKNRRQVGTIGDATIWKVTEFGTLPFARTTLHLTERELWYNRHFVDMINLVLSVDGYYYSTSYDLTHTAQRLHNTTPDFRKIPMHLRADERFVWNRHVLSDFSALLELCRFVTPLLHGFVSIDDCRLHNGRKFKLILISRRSAQRAGTRFFSRGLNQMGHPANFVETEQIVEFFRETNSRYLCSFYQTRGSIPLLWSQKPNLRWQPQPLLTADDSAQMDALGKHLADQMGYYHNANLVLVDLVNHKGRELLVGQHMRDMAVKVQRTYPNVKYYAFDFHKHCKGLNWDKLDILRNELLPFVKQFGFFGACVDNGASSEAVVQIGHFRSNCMDCLDRTNVVQSILAKESLIMQLKWLGALEPGGSLADDVQFDSIFKSVWADNGDACSVQYAGTGALKTDYTRTGKRTAAGMLNDAVNALTRYAKNNFMDGYRQDALALFLGAYSVDRQALPPSLATGPLDTLDWRAAVALTMLFAAAMALMCVFVTSEHAFQFFCFWLAVLFFCVAIALANGPEFVNQPKLKQD